MRKIKLIRLKSFNSKPPKTNSLATNMVLNTTWLTLEQACKYTKYSKRQIRRYIKKGQIKYTRRGRKYLFHYQWLDAFILGFGKKPTVKQLNEIYILNKRKMIGA